MSQQDLANTPAKSSDPLPEHIAQDWKNLEIELAEISRKLDELRAQPALIGESSIQDLEQRYDDVAKFVISIKKDTREEFAESQANDEADTTENIREKLHDVSAQVSTSVAMAQDKIERKVAELSEKTAPQREELSKATKDIAERGKQAASHISDGFSAAWNALKRDLDKAYEKLATKN